jgi:hypothetical protein
MKKKQYHLFVFLILLATPTLGKEWRGLVPLHSTRADVVERFGIGHDERNIRYDLENEVVHFFYTYGRCDPTISSGWDVPPDTILEINVTPKKKLLISELGIDKSKFIKSVYRDRSVSYTNGEEGFDIHVAIDEMSVIEIYYMPTAKDDGLRCANWVKKKKEREEATKRYLESLGGKEEIRPYSRIGELFITDNGRIGAALNILSVEMKDFPTVRGVIIFYRGKIAYENEIENWSKKIKRYLVRERKVKADRIVIIDGGFREKGMVEIYVVPNEAPLPEPRPDLRRVDVKIIKPRKKKK